MSKYHPIEQPIDMQTSLSDLLTLKWKENGIVADFIISDDEDQVLRVNFSKIHILRILDEMPLSTENDPAEGLVPEHFAYWVTGSLFAQSQSKAFWTVFKGARHYRFITGSTCLDVISDDEPRMSIERRCNSGHGRSEAHRSL